MSKGIPLTEARKDLHREGVEAKKGNDSTGYKAYLAFCDWLFLGFDFIILRHFRDRLWFALQRPPWP